MTRNKRILNITLTAMFMALLIAMTFIPYVGYIVYGGLSITTLHVVTILGATVLGPLYGTILGGVWGVTCLIYAMMNGTADAMIFLDPRISVIPRILVGLIAGWCFRALSRLLSKRKNRDWLAAIITAVVGTLSNTALVLSSISIFGTGVATIGGTLKTILATAIALNGLVELGIAIVLVPTISAPLLKIKRRYS